MNTTITSTAIVDSLYRPLLDVRKEKRRIYMRDYMRKYRAKKKSLGDVEITPVVQPVSVLNVTADTPLVDVLKHDAIKAVYTTELRGE